MKIQNYSVRVILRMYKILKRRSPFLLCMIGVVAFLFKWKLICVNMQPKLHINEVCVRYENGQVIGNLCQALCKPVEHSSVTCHSFHTEKAVVFSGMWMNYSAVFKSIKSSDHYQLSKKFDFNNNDISVEEKFIEMIKTVTKLKFNLSINDVDAKRLSYVQFSQTGGNRYIEMENVWSLIQDNEYLALSLYERFDVFPKLLGTCGSLYAVQKLHSISGYWHLITLFDSQKEWEKRVKTSLMILDFLLHLETDFPEPMLICDVKMNHFGLTNDFKKIKYLDLDSVHPLSIVNKMLANGADCKQHSDCDLTDCRSFCNLITYKCQHGLANNNLQIVCERIFLGWMMSSKIMVPGLLFGPKTPEILIEVLEQCANPSNENGEPRSPATRKIRNRLYNLLTHLVG